MCTRILRSGRVPSSNRLNSKSTKSGDNNTKTPETELSTKSVNLNNAHHSTAPAHDTTVKLSPSSKLAARVNDIEDLVGGQFGTWGHNTGSLSHYNELGVGGVTIKQEPGTCSVKQEPQDFYLNHGPPSMETFGGTCMGTYGSMEPFGGLGAFGGVETFGGMESYGGMGVYNNVGTFTGMDIKQEPVIGFVKEEPLEMGGVRRKTRLNGNDFIHWNPPLWKQQYENIRTMRADRTAPVDTNGCFMLAQKDVPPEVRRYQLLVSLMLSSQTKDQVTGDAMRKLTKHGLTVENILKTPQEDIAKMIYGVGFWKKKAEYMKRTTEILSTKFNGDIPEDVKGLISLPGIGPKMAHLVMDFAWGQVSGIAVDTHVHRIVHRLGWTPYEITNPEDCRVFLEAWFPRHEWSDLNLLFVGFGQQTCTPLAPKCTGCLNRDICPASSTRPENEGKAMFGKIGAKRKSPNKTDSTSKRRAVKIKQEQ